MLDMPRVREVFEASTDFTVGIEEEFAILDPETLSLDHRFEEFRQAAQEDPVLAESVAGELIRSEIEIRSGRGETFADAVARQQEARRRLFALAASRDALLGATGHASLEPLAGAADHRHRALPAVAGRLQYVAWRNNTFSCTCTSACAAPTARCASATGCAASARAARALGELAVPRRPHSGLHSARTQIFTKSFPRCGIPDAFGSWRRTPTTSTS
jgi:carboxylate-amine ligase